MGSLIPRGRAPSVDPYYYNNVPQHEQSDRDHQSGGYQDSPHSAVPNPRNSIFQQNNAANVFSQRTGRLYRPLPSQAGQLYYPASPSQSPYNENYPFLSQLGPGLENPYVLATLIAGMAGITLIIIIIVSIYILRSSGQKKKRAALARKTRSNYAGAGSGDADPEKGVPVPVGVLDSKKDSHPHKEVISELKQQQQAEKDRDSHDDSKGQSKFPFYKPRAKKGNILSKKQKNMIIENKSASETPGPGSNSVPICTSEVSGTIIAYEKTVEAGSAFARAGAAVQAPPVRVLKETFV